MKNDRLRAYFLLLWFGQLVSSIGSGLTAFSLGIYAFEKTQTATSFSMILLCIFLPPFLLKPLGGVLADRFDRRMMIILGDLGAGLGIVFIFLMMQNGAIGLWYIYLGIVLSSAFASVQEPAYKASVTDLLSEEQYARASGLMQLSSSAQYLISPFLAGFLLSLFNIELIFLIDIATFFFANLTVLWLRKMIGKTNIERDRKSYLAEFKEGVTEFLKHKGIVWLVGLTMVVLFFVGLLQSLLVPMLLSITDYKGAGLVQSLSVSGMLAGSMLIGVFMKDKNYVKTLSLALFLAGIFFAFMGVFTNLFAITFVSFLFFATLPFINTSIEVLIRKKIDNRKQGRIWSIVSVITFLGSIVAFTLAGFLADKVFNPLLELGGFLATSVGVVVGVGDSRGIGFMFLISGMMVSLLAIFVIKNKYIKNLEEKKV